MEDHFFDRPFKPGNDDVDIDATYHGIFSMLSELEPNLPADFFIRFRIVTFPVLFRRDQVIVDYGDICKYAFLMLSGVVRLTRILKSRGETSVMFLSAGDVLMSPKSFYSQAISDEKLTALMDTFCIALPWTALQALYQDFPGFHIVTRLLTEKYYLQALERSTWFYESPEVRYENMLKDYPTVVEHVPVKELASYLGIARETLSRLRRRISQKGKNSSK